MVPSLNMSSSGCPLLSCTSGMLVSFRCCVPTASCLLGGYSLSWFPLFVGASLCTLPPSLCAFLACLPVSWDIVIAPFLLWILSSLSSGLPLPTFFFRSQSLLCGSGLFFFLCHSGSFMTDVSRFTWPGPFMKWTNKPRWQWLVSDPAGYI